jgi:WD40 repeat protein
MPGFYATFLPALGDDQFVKIWKTKSRHSNFKAVDCYPEEVTDVYFAPDGQMMMSQSYDNVKIWDTDNSGKCLIMSILPQLSMSGLYGMSVLVAWSKKKGVLRELGHSLFRWDSHGFCPIPEDSAMESHRIAQLEFNYLLGGVSPPLPCRTVILLPISPHHCRWF